MPWSTPNHHLWRGWLVAAAGGRDAGSARLLWPSVWLEPLRRPSWDMSLWTVGLGWWSWRCRLTWGRRVTEAPADLTAQDLAGFPPSAEGRRLTLTQLKAHLDNDTTLAPVMVMGAGHWHYGRLLLARECAPEKPTAPTGPFSQLRESGSGGTHRDAAPAGH